MEEYKKFWNGYLKLEGRATRKEFWMPVLFNMIISGVLGAISLTLSSIFAILILVPGVTNAVRRFHDINKSGWWVLIEFVPIVGVIIYLVFLCTPSVNEGNLYGEPSGTVTADYSVAEENTSSASNNVEDEDPIKDTSNE